MDTPEDLAQLQIELLALRQELEESPPRDAGELRRLRARFLSLRDDLRQMRETR